MGGLARNFDEAVLRHELETSLEVAAQTRMPIDPRIWIESTLSSSYPACQAVKAAAEQGPEAGYRYLRRLREGIMCERRRLDHKDALLALGGEAGLDLKRFEIDLTSNAIIEALGNDLEEVRNAPPDAPSNGERVPFPTLRFAGPVGDLWVDGSGPYDELREAAVSAGATPRREPPSDLLEVIRYFGRIATREVEEILQRPRPLVEADLWAAARDWRVKPVPTLTGTLWELA
jgi:predicted DsbA family dithiol-disulfide isomerase